MKYTKIFAAVGLVLVASSAFCSTTTSNKTTPLAAESAEDKSVPKLIREIEKNTGYTFYKKVPGPSGTTGWVLSRGPGQNTTVFTTGDAKTVFLGAMDSNGVNVSKALADKNGPKVDYDAMWAKVEKSNYVSQLDTGIRKKGSTGPVLYVFADPNCGYCHKAYGQLEEYVAKGLEVRWIPVAFLAPTSEVKAAYLLTSTNVNEAVKLINTSKDGSAKLVGPLTPEIKEMLNSNIGLMHAMGFAGTPAMVAKKKDGSVVTTPGLPDAKWLEEATGIAKP